MRNQRVEPFVVGDEVEVASWILIGQASQVERQMEIERIFAATRNLDIFGPLPQLLSCRCGFKGDSRLQRSDEYHQPEHLVL